MIKVTIPLEKGIEIVISQLEKSRYYWNNVGRYLIAKNIIEDTGQPELVFNAVKDGSPELITYLLELI